MRLSIIIATYNCREDLTRTLESIFSQTASDYEVFVVDGCSTDGTLDVIQQHEGRIRYISEKDEGIYDAMNKGISLAQGDYLQFLNAGDIFTDDESLEKVQVFLNGKNDIVYGDIYIVSQQYRKIHHVRYNDFNLETLKTKGTGTCNHQSFFIRREKAPFYSTKYQLKSELNWYIQLASVDNIVVDHIKEPIVCYVIGGKGYVQFWRNFFEWLCITHRNFGFIQNFKNWKTYFRFFRYRFITSKKQL